jgi:hypothetical protein
MRTRSRQHCRLAHPAFVLRAPHRVHQSPVRDQPQHPTISAPSSPSQPATVRVILDCVPPSHPIHCYMRGLREHAKTVWKMYDLTRVKSHKNRLTRVECNHCNDAGTGNSSCCGTACFGWGSSSVPRASKGRGEGDDSAAWCWCQQQAEEAAPVGIHAQVGHHAIHLLSQQSCLLTLPTIGTIHADRGNA